MANQPKWPKVPNDQMANNYWSKGEMAQMAQMAKLAQSSNGPNAQPPQIAKRPKWLNEQMAKYSKNAQMAKYSKCPHILNGPIGEMVNWPK